jgi:hypothetical protein
MEDLNELRDEQREEQAEKEADEWADLEAAAVNARYSNQMWGPLREAVFIVGTILLSVGLLAVGFMGTGADRWICLIMLAIITFSLYVGGAAWISSIMNTLQGPGGF